MQLLKTSTLTLTDHIDDDKMFSWSISRTLEHGEGGAGLHAYIFE